MFGQEIHTLDLLSNPSLQCSESRNIHILPVVGQALMHTDPALGDIPFPIWCVQASSLRTFPKSRSPLPGLPDPLTLHLEVLTRQMYFFALKSNTLE